MSYTLIILAFVAVLLFMIGSLTVVYLFSGDSSNPEEKNKAGNKAASGSGSKSANIQPDKNPATKVHPVFKLQKTTEHVNIDDKLQPIQVHAAPDLPVSISDLSPDIPVPESNTAENVAKPTTENVTTEPIIDLSVKTQLNNGCEEIQVENMEQLTLIEKLKKLKESQGQNGKGKSKEKPKCTSRGVLQNYRTSKTATNANVAQPLTSTVQITPLRETELTHVSQEVSEQNKAILSTLSASIEQQAINTKESTNKNSSKYSDPEEAICQHTRAECPPNSKGCYLGWGHNSSFGDCVSKANTINDNIKKYNDKLEAGKPKRLPVKYISWAPAGINSHVKHDQCLIFDETAVIVQDPGWKTVLLDPQFFNMTSDPNTYLAEGKCLVKK